MNPDDDELLVLIRSDRKIEAIKHLRETRGLDLREAAAEVERLSASRTAVTAPAPERHAPQTVDLEVRRLAQAGRRIEAIRLLRERNGLGLKQAKDVLDATVPPPPSTGFGLRWVVVALLAAAVAWWLR